MIVNQLMEAFDKTNNLSFSPYDTGREVAEEITRKHRTIQGVIINLLLSILVHVGDTEYTDARNETAIKTCQYIRDSLNDGTINYQIFI